MAKKSKGQVDRKKKQFLRCIFGKGLEDMPSDDFAKMAARMAWNAMVVGRIYPFYSANTRRGHELRDFAISEVIRIAKKPRKGAGIAHITELQTSVNGHSAHRAMDGGAMKFGRAQKFFNMYFKFMWCAGKIPTPPHCPFDRKILYGKLPPDRDKFWNKWGGMEVLSAKKKHEHIWTWTLSDCEGDYWVWVAAAEHRKKEIGYRSLAEWELFEYDK